MEGRGVRTRLISKSSVSPEPPLSISDVTSFSLASDVEIVASIATKPLVVPRFTELESAERVG